MAKILFRICINNDNDGTNRTQFQEVLRLFSYKSFKNTNSQNIHFTFIQTKTI